VIVQVPLKTRLGLIAAGHLALHADEGWITTDRIAKRYGVEKMYLHKIIQEMVTANILKSQRGLNGGVKLARPLNEICLLEIIETASGESVYRIDMPEIEGTSPFGSGLQELLTRASDRAASILSKANLGQMIPLDETRIANDENVCATVTSEQADWIITLAKARLGPDLAYMVSNPQVNMNHLIRFKCIADMCLAKRKEKQLSFETIASQLKAHYFLPA